MDFYFYGQSGQCHATDERLCGVRRGFVEFVRGCVFARNNLYGSNDAGPTSCKATDTDIVYGMQKAKEATNGEA